MSSEYLPFANLTGAHVMPQAQWAALSARSNGFQIGRADSAQFNKAWRQASVVAAAVAAFIDARVPVNILDDGNVEALAGLLAQAVGNVAQGSGILEAPTDGRQFVRQNAGWTSTETLRLDGGSW